MHVYCVDTILVQIAPILPFYAFLGLFQLRQILPWRDLTVSLGEFRWKILLLCAQLLNLRLIVFLKIVHQVQILIDLRDHNLWISGTQNLLVNSSKLSVGISYEKLTNLKITVVLNWRRWVCLIISFQDVILIAAKRALCQLAQLRFFWNDLLFLLFQDHISVFRHSPIIFRRWTWI